MVQVALPQPIYRRTLFWQPVGARMVCFLWPWYGEMEGCDALPLHTKRHNPHILIVLRPNCYLWKAGCLAGCRVANHALSWSPGLCVSLAHLPHLALASIVPSLMMSNLDEIRRNNTDIALMNGASVSFFSILTRTCAIQILQGKVCPNSKECPADPLPIQIVLPNTAW